MSESIENKFKSTDSYRQFSEMEKAQTDRLIDKFCLCASQTLSAFLSKELRCDNSKILNIDSKLSVDEDTSLISGEFTVKAEILHAGESKILEIPLKAEKGEMILPTVEVLNSVIKSTQSLQMVASLKLKKEIDNNIVKINEYQEARKNGTLTPISTEIKKEAASAPSGAGNLLSDVLKVNKAFMPTGIKVGDVIFIDSAKYRVVNGDEDKLNSEGSGVYWTLSRLIDVLGKDEVVIDVQNKF
jgi:hypothetical protein